jgi:hypothetical protein
MKTLTTILLLSITLSLAAQKDTTSDQTLSSFDIYYGVRPFFGDLYHQLNSTTNFSFSPPIRTIGIGTSGHFIMSRASDFYGHFVYNQILPEAIHIQDTIKAKITGFIFSFAYGGAVTTTSGVFAFYFYLGLNTGRLKITGDENLAQKNPFFAPKIGVQPKIKLGRIALTFIFEYDYDISKTSWRRTLFAKVDQVNIAPFRQTALTGQVGLGYLF